MRDKRELMVQFAKIVERHPELYNHTLAAYKTRKADAAWEKVCVSVRNELNEECTVEELKIKWKGLRCSFNRCKRLALYSSESAGPITKYYLYEALKFLDPFTRPKGSVPSDSMSEDCFKNEDDESKSNSNIRSVENTNKSKKKKHSRDDKGVDDVNEDLQFFKSILPDIKDFTNQEKRKLKVGILQLIDDLANERNQQ